MIDHNGPYSLHEVRELEARSIINYDCLVFENRDQLVNAEVS